MMIKLPESGHQFVHESVFVLNMCGKHGKNSETKAIHLDQHREFVLNRHKVENPKSPYHYQSCIGCIYGWFGR